MTHFRRDSATSRLRMDHLSPSTSFVVGTPTRDDSPRWRSGTVTPPPFYFNEDDGFSPLSRGRESVLDIIEDVLVLLSQNDD